MPLAVRTLPLVTLQSSVKLKVRVSPGEVNVPAAYEKIVSLTEKRQINAEEVLSAILGEGADRLSIIKGFHPKHPNEPHPVHRLINRSLLERTSNGFEIEPVLIREDNPVGSMAVIGGPISSRHAKAVFGFFDQPSILPAPLPVMFDLYRGEPTSGRGARFAVNGTDITDEHVLLTSLPMNNNRFVNISALTSVGGSAVDLILSDQRLIADLFTRTRGKAGWQALFRVLAADENGARKPVGIAPEFHVFEVKGIDFDAQTYELNANDFLIKYRDIEYDEVGENNVKVEKCGKTVQYVGMSKDITAVDIAKAIEKDQVLRSELLQNEKFRALVGLPEIGRGARPSAAFGKAAQAGAPDLKPAELWAERTTGRKENPAAFIRRVYANELAEGKLTRAALRVTDRTLYQAYATLISRNPGESIQVLEDNKPYRISDPSESIAHRRNLDAARAQRYRKRHVTN